MATGRERALQQFFQRPIAARGSPLTTPHEAERVSREACLAAANMPDSSGTSPDVTSHGPELTSIATLFDASPQELIEKMDWAEGRRAFQRPKSVTISNRLRYACPYGKREPSKYGRLRSCSNGFTSIHSVR